MFSKKKTKRPGFKEGLFSLINIFILVLFIRWIGFEIFMIPSGSMYPKLYVSDYIFVTKLDFGIRIPFTQKWVWGPYLPKQGAITVFKDMDDSKFLIKRIVGLPGDKVKFTGDFIFSINSKPVVYEKLKLDDKILLAEKMGFDPGSFDAYKETLPGKEEAHIVLVDEDATPPTTEDVDGLEVREIPQGKILFMGDNRHQSYDGRRFGFVPQERLVGRARYVVLSCKKRIVANLACDFMSLRTNRLGNEIAY